MRVGSLSLNEYSTKMGSIAICILEKKRDFTEFLTSLYGLRISKSIVFFKSVKSCLSSWSILTKNTLRNAGDEEKTNVENVKNLM